MESSIEHQNNSGILIFKHFISYKALLIIFAVIFSILFSFYSILKAYTLNAYAWDLGLYSQAFYSTLHGQLFYTNLLGESYLAEHFSPFLFILLLPFYIFPSPYTLLILQAIVISISIIPLYYISLEVFKLTARKYQIKAKKAGFISFLIGTTFLLSPLTESPIYFDFHLMVFLPFFYFMSIYFFIKEKTWLNYLFLALMVSLHSSFVFIAMATLIMELFLSEYLFENKNKKKIYFNSSIALALLVSYYVFAMIAKGYIGSGYISTSIFSTGKSHTFTNMLPLLVSDPYKILILLTSNYEVKILFLVLAFLAIDFIFYEYPPGLIPALPYLVYAMVSSYIPYYMIGYQYSMMLIPTVFVSGILGISVLNVKSAREGKKGKKASKYLHNVLVAMVAFAIAAFVVVSPLSPVSVMPNGIHTIINDSGSMEGKEAGFLRQVRNDIDMNSSLVTGEGIFPLFYQDLNATAFPYASVSGTVPYYRYLIVNMNDSQSYINDSENLSLAGLAYRYGNSSDYGILAEGYNIVVLERNYTLPPKIYVPSTEIYHSKYFVSNCGRITGPMINSHISSLKELQLVGEDHYLENKTFLLPGNYSVIFEFNSTIESPSNLNVSVTAYNGSGNIHISDKKIQRNSITFKIDVPTVEQNVQYSIIGNITLLQINYMQLAQISS
ncbi:MAG: DUF2079 domain-containing protein [Ferroplasma sp.]